MWLKTDESLTESQVQSGLAYIIKDGVASQAMGILTGGAFLVAFAVKLEASNLVIGLLAAIGPLSQLLQLPAIFLVEKLRNRRAMKYTTTLYYSSPVFWQVLQELMAEVRSQVKILSSVEGLRQMVSFPFSVVRNISVKMKTKNVSGDKKGKDIER